MRIGLVHTTITQPEQTLLKGAITQAVNGPIEFYEVENETLLQQLTPNGALSPSAMTALLGMYMDCVAAGCRVILSTCASVAAACHALQPALAYQGAALISIEEGMCKIAVERGSRIAVAATRKAALEQVSTTLQHHAHDLQKPCEVIPVLIPIGEGLADDIALAAVQLTSKADVILLAQPSLEHAYIQKKGALCGKLLGVSQWAAQEIKAAIS